MSPFEIPQTINLRAENAIKSYEQVLVYGNKRAHRWRITVLDGKAPANLAGCTAALYISRQDGKTVEVTDGITIRGETVEAIFPAEAYAVEGSTVFELDIMMGEDVVSYATLCATVRRSRTDDMIIPGTGEIYDLAALLAQIDAMKTATTAANAAAANADAKATAANTATGNANTATGKANAGADSANKAAAKINGMTIAASGLSAGASPTAALSEVDGHYHIALGIPRGDTGATPQISVQVQTGEAGSEAQVSVSGTAENPVIHLTIPRGDAGDIGALTINGKAPDASGAVTLTMSDIDGLADVIENAGGVKTVSGVSPDTEGNVPLKAENVGALPSGATAADSSKLGGKSLSDIMLELYPVGSIYMSASATSPASIFGGTWQSIENTFLLAAGSSYAAGTSGGEAAHKLTNDEMPSHNHKMFLTGSDISSGTGKTIINTSTYTANPSSYKVSQNIWNETIGGNAAHNNMPPYLAVYMWERVA